MSNEQLTMYWGLHDLWGQGARRQHGSKLKLGPLTPRSLPLLPSCSSSLQLTPSLLQLTPSSPPAVSSLPAHSSLLPACSQLSPTSQLAPACSSSLQPPSLLQLAPSSLPVCSSLPAHSSSLQLAPSSLQLAPKCPMNSLVCISVPTNSGGQGARGQGWSKLKLAPLTPRWLPSIPSRSCHSPHSQLTRPHSQCPMNSLLCIGVPTTSGSKGLWGNVGASWTLLSSLPSPCSCHSPHSHLTGPHSQCPMNSLVCIGVPTTSGGKGLGGKEGASWSWLPSLPDDSPHSQVPALTPLTPSLLDLAPKCQWTVK